MSCGPGVACTPGEESMNAVTTSTWPSIAAEKIVARAPCSSSSSAISRLPVCDAAPSAVSQSPNPQSHDALASAGRGVTSFPDPLEIEMRDGDHFLDRLRILMREGLGDDGIIAAGACGEDVRAKPGHAGCGDEKSTAGYGFGHGVSFSASMSVSQTSIRASARGAAGHPGGGPPCSDSPRTPTAHRPPTSRCRGRSGATCSCVANQTPPFTLMCRIRSSSAATRERCPHDVRVHREDEQAALLPRDIELALEHLDHDLGHR